MNHKKIVRGVVKMITCLDCGSSIPLFEFYSETDNDAVGLCSAALCNGTEIVIAEVTLDEWKKIYLGESLRLPSQICGDTYLKNLHILHIKRVEECPNPTPGMLFSEYRKIYKPPVTIYFCPCCVGSDAVESQEFSVSKYKEMGGRITTLGNIEVVE